MKRIKHIDKVKRPVVRQCPCAVDHVSCGYAVISHIIGCPYNCTYCFLHTFYGGDEIVVYNNEADILNQAADYLAKAEGPLRVGTGQYSDSLAIAEARSLAGKLVEFFAGQDRHLFELKTKSVEVDQLLNLGHNGKTVIAWSVNPEKIAKSEELGAESLADRLAAAKKCAAAGYPVAFHFDPIIYYSGWEKDYQGVVEQIFSAVAPKQIAWISLGALRKSQNGRLRYPEQLRVEIFRQMREFIRRHCRNVYIYLCMESAEVWQEAGIGNQTDNPYLKYFKFFKK